MNRDWICQRLLNSADVKWQLAVARWEQILEAGQRVAEAFRRGGKVLLFGNGGSAADAQHIAAEFVGRFLRERSGLPALALTANTSSLTAIGNDYGFDRVFSRQVHAFARPEDVVIGISTTGNSPNVIAGIEAARDVDAATIGLTGGGGGALADVVDVPIVVASQHTPRIQEGHIAVGHLICELVDAINSEAANEPQIVRAIEGDWYSPKIVELAELLPLRGRLRRLGKQVVWTNGCFDLFHAGHLRSLQAARELGDVLVVGLNSDASVSRLKGDGRPIVPEKHRAVILAGLQCVDFVVIFSEDTPEDCLSQLQPDVHCKGRDYIGRPIAEAALVEGYGGRIEFLPMVEGLSTTSLLAQFSQGEAASMP